MGSEDDKLDETLEETFPASDPPANTVETGIHLGEIESASSQAVVRDNPETSQFEIVVDGQTAFLKYERRGNTIDFLHTEVPDSLRGRGIATQLAKVGVESSRAKGLTLVVHCPVVRAYLRKNR